MGKDCGMLAVNASLASRDVNICVVPEISFQLFGNEGVYESVIERAKKKGHCIIVVAEGAFQGLVDEDKEAVIAKLGGKSNKTEHTGWESPEVGKSNLTIDLAPFIRDDLNSYAQANHKIKLTIKYLDPKRAIRTYPANAEDTQICHSLALSAAHSAMAGYTDFAVGIVRC